MTSSMVALVVLRVICTAAGAAMMDPLRLQDRRMNSKVVFHRSLTHSNKFSLSLGFE